MVNELGVKLSRLFMDSDKPIGLRDEQTVFLFYNLVIGYYIISGKKAVHRLKFTKGFKAWVEQIPSVDEGARQKLSDNWESISDIIPKIRLEEVRKIVVDQWGGKLHSTEYINSRMKMKVECKEGHIFEPTADSLQQGHWCRKCAGTELGSLEEVRKIVEAKGGKLHSTVYINDITYMEVECEKGHIFPITPVNIKQRWCPECAGNKRGSLEKVRKIVEARGGKLHSTEYINNRTKMKVECREGHIFYPRSDDLQRGHWCGECLWRRERACRNIFEVIFDVKFPKKRPEWLVNNRGNQMELDGFNEELMLAFEHQGKQHYSYVKYFHKTLEAFEQRVKNDKRKRELCKENGVTLIEIPYSVRYEQIPDYIIDECMKKNIEIPYNDKEIDFQELINKAYIGEGTI